MILRITHQKVEALAEVKRLHEELALMGLFQRDLIEKASHADNERSASQQTVRKSVHYSPTISRQSRVLLCRFVLSTCRHCGYLFTTSNTTIPTQCRALFVHCIWVINFSWRDIVLWFLFVQRALSTESITHMMVTICWELCSDKFCDITLWCESFDVYGLQTFQDLPLCCQHHSLNSMYSMWDCQWVKISMADLEKVVTHAGLIRARACDTCSAIRKKPRL